ncbi:MAG: AMP-binding protein, partial [Dechloromonas agitata]|nr:AMP-binding protein [Dechloromonas agitata]
MKPASSLHAHLARGAAEGPARPALLAEGRSWTFAELAAQASATAAVDDTRPWAGSGTPVELALAAYRCSAAGRACFPLPPERQAPALDKVPPGTALIISTSGSEGQPRAVLLGTAQLDAAAAAANVALDLRAGDLWLACLPLYHIGGQSILWRCARAGAGVLLHEGFAIDELANDLVTWPVTHVSLVPAMLARLLDHGIAPPSTLRAVLIGGAALSRPLYERASAAGWPLFVSYGMSETAAMAAVFQPADGVWHEGLVGRALPGHEFRIGDDGRIRLRGPQVMIGYLGGGGPDAE